MNNRSNIKNPIFAAPYGGGLEGQLKESVKLAKSGKPPRKKVREMRKPGHSFDRGKMTCSCGWTPDCDVPVHSEVQWGAHLAEARAEAKRQADATRRAGMSRETALHTLRKIANSTGDQTVPTEDVIDVARAVLALIGEL